MDIRDDFHQWESELREKPRKDRRPLVAAAILPVALTVIIAIGEVALGIAAGLICVLILVLWKVGM